MQIYPQVALTVIAILAERLEKANQRAGVDFISLSRFAQLIPKPEAAAPARPPTGRAGGVDSNSAQAATIDLLQSDLIRELQLAESVQDTAETKQDLMSASEDAPTIRLANSILGLAIKQERATFTSSRWRRTSPSASAPTACCRLCGGCRKGAARAHLAREDPEQARHLREAVAAGRAHQRDDGGEAD